MKKPLIVQKFGGTSMGSIETIQTVAKHVMQAKQQGSQVVVVVSAMAGETNRLVQMAQEIDSVPDARELDVLMSAGEQVSMALLAMTLNSQGISAQSLTGGQAGITTNHQYNDASITHIDTTKIFSLLEQDKVVIIAGFQGVNEEGDITTLGRGGSDTSAVTLAGYLNADECQIFTDVDGVYTADPRIIADAEKLTTIDFPAMEEMARKGAKVLHLPCVQFAWKNNVPLRVLSTFEDNRGTLIEGGQCSRPISGIAVQREMMLLEIERDQLSVFVSQCQMLGIEIWDSVDEAGKTSILIKQDVYAKLALIVADKIKNSQSVGLLTLVGHHAQSLSNDVISLLLNNKIAPYHSFCCELSLSVILDRDSLNDAANLCHNRFITDLTYSQHDGKKVVIG